MWRRAAMVMAAGVLACGDERLVPLVDTVERDAPDGRVGVAFTPPSPDADGDGFAENRDCADTDARVYPMAIERCNGVDDDCDGEIDESVPAAMCYEADPELLRHGTCRAGVTSCIGGIVLCVDAIYPSAESCNGVDDDCNGLVDERGPEFDVVLILDSSGSMNPYLWKLHNALVELNYAPRFHWAALGVVDGVTLLSDFVDARTMAARIAALPIEGRYEHTLDALTVAPTLFDLRRGAERRIVLATDEAPQSYAVPPLTVRAVTDLLTVPTYVLGSKDNAAAFGPLARATGGAMLDLVDGTAALAIAVPSRCD